MTAGHRRLRKGRNGLPMSKRQRGTTSADIQADILARLDAAPDSDAEEDVLYDIIGEAKTTLAVAVETRYLAIGEMHDDEYAADGGSWGTCDCCAV
jgi:hypothetical protein